MKEYKTISLGKFNFIAPLLGLFIPLPIFSRDPDFSIYGYGFGASISLSKIPLGVIIILVNLIM